MARTNHSGDFKGEKISLTPAELKKAKERYKKNHDKMWGPSKKSTEKERTRKKSKKKIISIINN
ncbi:MAG: hypothetical protein EAX96_21210 [Candidatus Lokiarchaeota archaeon]|nr:hypothetical protein [Candidatus Lokiarchaeota archaeon]